MDIHGYLTFLPYAVLLVAVAWALFAERLPLGDKGAAGMGALLSFVAAALFVKSDIGGLLFGGKILFTTDARFACAGMSIMTGIWLMWTAGRAHGRIREAVALGVLSLMGGCLMVSASDLIVMVLGIELATMPAYVLIGYRRNRINGLEGAIKYFLLSVLASLLMIYGITFVYGIAKTTSFAGLNLAQAGTLGLVAMLLLFVGVFAKISAAPFHYWAPDAYEGAETWIVAFVSSVPKVAGIVLAMRLVSFIDAASKAPAFQELLGLIILIASVASMILGSFAALTQSDTKRVMAYSGVVNAGYMLMPLISMTASSVASVALYSVFYGLSGLGLLLIAGSEGGKISNLAGLSKRRPAAAWALAISALSMVGVPPMAGFFGKFYMFTSTVQGGNAWVVVLATVASIVSAFYYLRFVKAAFFDVAPEDIKVPEEVAAENAIAEANAEASAENLVAPEEKVESKRTTLLASVAIAVTTILVVGLGPLSGFLLEWIVNPTW